MQWIIMKLGWILQSIVGTTLCESITAAANPFIGMVVSKHALSETELDLVLTRSYVHGVEFLYLSRLTHSDFTVMLCFPTHSRNLRC
jgi:nucleoside permease NupC